MINKEKIVVAITSQESEAVERLFYLHKAGQNNIAFLAKDKDVQYDILQEYIDVVEARFVELDMLKKELGEKYKPDLGKEYNFTFDFDNNAIIFEEA